MKKLMNQANNSIILFSASCFPFCSNSVSNIDDFIFLSHCWNKVLILYSPNPLTKTMGMVVCINIGCIQCAEFEDGHTVILSIAIYEPRLNQDFAVYKTMVNPQFQLVEQSAFFPIFH